MTTKTVRCAGYEDGKHMSDCAKRAPSADVAKVRGWVRLIDGRHVCPQCWTVAT